MKLKKIISAFLAAGIMTASLSFMSFAADDPIVINIPPEYCDGLGDVNDVAPEVMFYNLKPDRVFKGAYFNQLDEDSQTAYNAIYEAYKNNANTNETIISISNTFTNVPISGSTVQTPASVNAWAVDIVRPAFLALIYDHPELSWLVNVSYSTGASNLEIKNNKGSSCDLEATGIKFKLSNAYTNTGNASDIKTAVSGALTAVNSSRGSDKSVYNTLKCANDYLAKNITYNTKAAQNGYTSDQSRAYQTAYSAFYKCNGDSVLSTVCAGYAKGFKVICDAYGIPCILVSGQGGISSKGPHMWNYVYINEKWWGVDVTWNDQGDNIYYDFFLVGGDDKPSPGWGDCTFMESHIPSGDWAGTGNIFMYPTLASGECSQSEANATVGNGNTDNIGGSIGNTGDGGGSSGGVTDVIISEPGTIWAFGKDIKDDKRTPVDETANYKTYSWEHIAMYSGGKWMAAVTSPNINKPADFIKLFDADGKFSKSEADKVKKTATAKIKDGVVTVSAGTQAGNVSVWVYELKRNPVTKKNEVVFNDSIAPVCRNITVLNASNSPVIAESGDFTNGVLAAGKKAVSTLNLQYNVGGSQNTSYLLIGDKKIAFDSKCHFSGQMSKSGIVNSSLTGNTLSITPLDEGKTAITIKNTQSSKTAKISVNVVKAYPVTFDSGITVTYKSGKDKIKVSSGDYVPKKTSLEVSASGKTLSAEGGTLKNGKIVVDSSPINITAK